MKAYFKNTINGAVRFLRSLDRPSKKENMRQLNRRGDMPDEFKIREATAADVHDVAVLHVQVWDETYKYYKQKPTLKTREWQWQEMFKEKTDDWFVLLVICPQGKVVGFAKGQRRDTNELPDYTGELNKIYLLQEYQRIGLGKKLITAIANRLLHMGINSMVLFGEAGNPSCRFHEKMGATRLYAANGEFHGAYGWHDLQELVTLSEQTARN